MRRRSKLLTAAVVGYLPLAAACAVSQPAPSIMCTVEGRGKLPASAGNAREICVQVEQALGSLFGSGGTRVRIEVISDSGLAAHVTLPDGRSLPVRNVHVSDRQLGPSSVRMLVGGIVEDVKAAANPS